MMPRDIEKLEALGYEVVSSRGRASDCSWVACEPVWLGKLAKNPSGHIAWIHGRTNQAEGWDACKAHAQSPDGLKATMADKVRWLIEPTRFPSALHQLCLNGRHFAFFGALGDEADGYDSPEAAVDALFWKVP